jgi:hypothetical protein
MAPLSRQRPKQKRLPMGKHQQAHKTAIVKNS